MLKNHFVVLFLLFFYSTASFSNQKYSDIRVLESNRNTLVIEFIPIYSTEIQKLKSGSEVFDLIEFKNSVSNSSLNYRDFIGKPDIHFRNILLGMPALEGYKVEIVSGEFEIIGNINIPPVPGYIKDEDSLPSVKIFRKDQNVFNHNNFYPEQTAYLNKPGIARDQILANLIVFPYQYNPSTRELKKYKKLIIKIVFGNQNPKNISSFSIQSKKINDPLISSLINSEQAKSWNVKEISSRKSFTSVKGSVLAGGNWYKLEVSEEGIYKLDAKFFKDAGMDLKSIDPKTIKIYGNGGMEVPESVSQSRIDDLLECAIYVSNETDSEFKDDNFVVFFGKGAKGWNYDPDTKKYSHYINHYSANNYYFLTFGGLRGKRMSIEKSVSSDNYFRPSTLINRCFIEPEEINFNESGREWFGELLNNNKKNVLYSTSQLDGLLPDMAITYKSQCVLQSETSSSFDLFQNEELIGQINVFGTVDYQDDIGYKAQKSQIYEFTKKTTIKDHKFNLKLKLNSGDQSTQGCLDWIEIIYNRSLNTNSDLIIFNTPDTNCCIEYDLKGFKTSNIYVFNVREHNEVKLLNGAEISGGNIKFRINSIERNALQYFVISNNGFKTISQSQLKKINNGNLHGISDGAGLIVITHKNLLTEANRYKNYRENNKKNKFKTIVVDIDSIYNEFSGGLLDPTAIRDFVKFGLDNWKTKPKYLLLFGDGNFAYKKFSSSISIPPYETRESLYQMSSYCNDAYFVRVVGEDERDDLAIGRITAQNPEDAKNCVDKIISYETNNSFGNWRNTLTFVADDWWSGSYVGSEISFTQNCEGLCNEFCPSTFEKKKIYAADYSIVYSFSGRLKPSVNKAIIDQLKEGTLLITYFGHSNTEYWAHENIFLTSEVINELHNNYNLSSNKVPNDKLPFFISGSCSFGKYDKLGNKSSSEILLTEKNVGAIAVYSSCAGVYDNNNYYLIQSLYQYMFNKNAENQVISIGDAILYAKQTHFGEDFDKFQLLGDPVIQLNIPRYKSKLDSINSKSSDSIIQLKALSKITLKGKILNEQNIQKKDFEGKILITLNDASKNILIDEGGSVVNFKKNGEILYRGEGSIKNGEFSSTFYIPKDISYENKNGRIGLYFQNGEIDGSGVTENIIIGGTDTTNNSDDKGPVVNVYIGDRNFHDGDLVPNNPKLIVDLYDESGMNLSGGIGHTFEAWLDNNSRISLIDKYQGKTDSYQEGNAEYILQDLNRGVHSLKVKAFDVFNNLSMKEVYFKVAGENELSVMNVVNYPNPFSNNTKFTFQQNQDSPIDVAIKIYTVAGRLIKVIEEKNIGNNFVQIEWDGRDEDGDLIANGVYLYKVLCYTRERNFSYETVGKLSVIR